MYFLWQHMYKAYGMVYVKHEPQDKTAVFEVGDWCKERKLSYLETSQALLLTFWARDVPSALPITVQLQPAHCFRVD